MRATSDPNAPAARPPRPEHLVQGRKLAVVRFFALDVRVARIRVVCVALAPRAHLAPVRRDPRPFCALLPALGQLSCDPLDQRAGRLRWAGADERRTSLGP